MKIKKLNAEELLGLEGGAKPNNRMRADNNPFDKTTNIASAIFNLFLTTIKNDVKIILG